MKRKLIFLLFFLSFSSLFGIVRDLVETIRNVQINSIFQHIIDQNQICFEGNVEVIIDDNLHVWADKVFVDKKEQYLKAEPKISSCIKLEGNNFLLLADLLFINFDDRSVKAENVRMDLDGRFIIAKKAEKTADNKWIFYNLSYTACDKDIPHWSFHSTYAEAQKYLIYARNILFKIGPFPVICLPIIAIPSQNKSSSGLMFPRFFISKRYGLGYNQAIYFDLAPNIDSTIGVNWKQLQGVEVYNQFRRGKSKESYLVMDLRYARDWNFITEKDSMIVKSKVPRNRYEIEGVFFDRMRLHDLVAHHVSRINYATDTRIDYDFLNIADAIEEWLVTSWTSRLYKPLHQAFLSFEWTRVFRKRFTTISPNEPEKKKDTEDKFEVLRAPHLEWNSGFYSLFKNFYYRHDLFFDGIFFHRTLTTKEIVGSEITKVYVKNILPHDSTARFFYQGLLKKNFQAYDNFFSLNFSPNIQFRGNINPKYKNEHTFYNNDIAGEGGYRILFKSKFEWTLPSISAYNHNKNRYYFGQDIVSWTFIPKAFQRNWFLVDEFDKIFPQNEVKFESRHFAYLNNLEVDFIGSIAYDFYKQVDLLPLRRYSTGKYAVPLKLQSSVSYKDYNVSFLQEYDLMKRKLVQVQFDTALKLWDIEAKLSWIYQNPKIQRAQELFSNIPTFLYIDLRVPLFKKLFISYYGQFYNASSSPAALFYSSKIFFQRIKVDYFGHCWGVSVAYEHKQNRQEGVSRPETLYVLAFSLQSLGEFSKRFRSERQLMKAPVNYQ